MLKVTRAADALICVSLVLNTASTKQRSLPEHYKDVTLTCCFSQNIQTTDEQSKTESVELD